MKPTVAIPHSLWLLGGLLLVTVGGCSPAEPAGAPSKNAANEPAPADTNAKGTGAEDTVAQDASNDAPSTTKPPEFELDAERLLAARLEPSQTQQGWVRLFDGSTLFGWTMTGKANWGVVDDTIRVSEGEQSLLYTSVPWSDFECQLEFRAPAQTNSGIFLRTPLMPTDPTTDCYELNIAPPENPFPTGSLVGRRKLDAAQLQERLGTTAENPWDPDAWHRYEIRAEGGTLTIRLDGKLLYEYTDDAPLLKGRIALQHNQGPVEFRNIMARPLGLTPLLPTDLPTDAETIPGWKRYPEMDGSFSITEEGELHARGGKNQLESEQQYDDFALLVEAKTAGPGQNSGIFFRCIPGEEMNGYECQINNDAQDNNPLLPKDCGTGGIFRRQDARIIAADNDQWFHVLLIADGPHIAAWVNGLQVSEWTDTRPADPNPRRGLRLEPGTIMLQAHDPGTDVRFRQIEIAAP